jgi:predicted nucleotide-binding protein
MADLKKRFEGAQNKARLLEAVRKQKLVFGDEKLTEAFVEGGTLQELAAGEVLITQGAWDDDLYLILAGEFEVSVNGRPQAIRGPGVHVGELTGLDGARPRTATLKSRGESLVLKIAQAIVNEAAGEDPAFWRRAANVVADRLDERNQKIGKTNDIPRVMVISSSESKPIMDQVALNLDCKEVAVQTWDKGTFGVSDYPLSSLMDAIEGSDFTISIVRADDTLISRGKTSSVARDNVHLEYGISLGTLGRLRSIVLVCADDNLHLPSDLAGLTTLRYRNGSVDEMERSVRNACIEARKHILSEGVFQDRKSA